MESLKQEIKELIISSLELDGMTADDIGDDEALFGEGLALDSVDALELGIAIKKKYGIVFPAEKGESREHFRSVSALSKYILEHRGND